MFIFYYWWSRSKDSLCRSEECPTGIDVDDRFGVWGETNKLKRKYKRTRNGSYTEVDEFPPEIEMFKLLISEE